MDFETFLAEEMGLRLQRRAPGWVLFLPDVRWWGRESPLAARAGWVGVLSRLQRWCRQRVSTGGEGLHSGGAGVQETGGEKGVLWVPLLWFPVLHFVLKQFRLYDGELITRLKQTRVADRAQSTSPRTVCLLQAPASHWLGKSTALY